MRIKGISFWEQHLERFILGLAILVFVAFTAMQFIGEPNGVETNGKRFDPADVDEALEAEATDILVQLANDHTPPIDLGEVDTLHDDIRSSIRDSVSPEGRIPPFTMNIMPAIDNAARAGALVHVPVIPPAAELRSEQFMDSVVDEFVSAQPDVQALLGEPPYDLPFTTVSGSFSIGEVRAAFAARGPNDEASLPAHWHHGHVHVVDVWLERQELINGAWSESVTIDPKPTQFTYRNEISRGVNPAFADGVAAQLRGDPYAQLAIIQPDMLPLENDRWAPPLINQEAPGAAGSGQDPLLRRIHHTRRLLSHARERAAWLFRQLRELGGPYEDGHEPEDRSGNDNTGEFSEGSGDRGLTPPSGTETETQRRERRRLTQAWRRALEKVADLEEELAALGVEVMRDEDTTPFDPVAELLQDDINIWAHDLTVEPETTYRYRMRVDVLNPLYGRTLFLHPEQHDLAASFALSSEWSKWSSPIQTQSPLEVFITAANKDMSGAPNDGMTVRADVFRYFDGRWWKKGFRLRPGERVSSVGQTHPATNALQRDARVKIDFTTNWFVLDVVPGVESGTAVYLQSFTSPSDVMVRYLTDDRSDPLRRELEDEITSYRDFRPLP